MTSKADIAWAAGLFEGEGCFWSSRCGKAPHYYIYPRVSLNSTDRDVLERFARVVGVGTVATSPRLKKQAHHKAQWSWVVSRKDDVRKVYELLKPWLGSRRRAQAESALSQSGKRVS